jgi:hypothetical protein
VDTIAARWEMFGFLKQVYWVFPRFKTQNLEASLAEAFGLHERLYGRSDDRFSVHYPKLAITTTKSTGGAYVVTTYNRQFSGSWSGIPSCFDIERANQPHSARKRAV